MQERHHVAHGKLCAVRELAVRLHVRTAAGRVRDHVIDARERSRVAAGESARRLEPPVVRLQGAAAPLVPRHRHAPPRAREHPDRGEVHVVEPPVLHAAREQRDRAADLDARGWFGERRQSSQRRRPTRHECPHAARHQRTGDRLQHGGGPDQRRMRQHDVEPEPSQQAGLRRRGAAPARCARAPSCGRTARATGRRPRTRDRRGIDP